MYALRIPNEVLVKLKSAELHSPSIGDRLVDLQNNPLSNAIETKIQAFGDYYVNAGRWCILFDVDEKGKVVNVLALLLSAKLHKILIGKISPNL